MAANNERYIQLFDELDQLRKEGKEGSDGPHLHVVVTYKDMPGRRTEAYQVGALGLSTRYVYKEIEPDGSIYSAGSMSGIDWDQWLGRLDHMYLTELKVRKERGEELDEHEKKINTDDWKCDCIDCKGDREDVVDWKSHRRKLMDGAPGETMTEEDKREEEERNKQLEEMVSVFREGNPDLKVVKQDPTMQQLHEMVLDYEREVNKGNQKCDRSPERAELNNRLLRAETPNEFVDMLKEYDDQQKTERS